MDANDLFVCGISYIGLSSSVLDTKQKALEHSFSHPSHKGLSLMHLGQTLLAAVWSPRILSDVELVSTLRPHDGQCPQVKPSYFAGLYLDQVGDNEYPYSILLLIT